MPILFYTVGEPTRIRTLDFRVKINFNMRDFRRKSCENTKEFLTSDFKIADKNYSG